jgi:prepilin-type N-terminal cleavage/methylation domain-containing protein
MCMNNGKREQCGFTLIEILIVVIILGVLAAIVIPAFSQHSSDAHLNVCLENLRLIQGALSIYRMKVGTYPSSANDLVGYWTTDPVCPLGGSYDWTLNDDAYHVRCSAQHTPSSNHVCIREGQGPTVK